MSATWQIQPSTISRARLAGALYLGIIISGITSEFALRGPLLSGPAPIAAITAHETTFRLSLVGDLVMILADIALALVLYDLLRPISESRARAAMVFRLIQASLIGTGLVALNAVPMLAATGQIEAARIILSAHAAGYDIALVFFGVTTFLTAGLLHRGGAAPSVLTAALFAAAPVYVVGGLLRLVAPELVPVIQPAYLVPFLSETALAVWLLIAARPTLRYSAL